MSGADPEQQTITVSEAETLWGMPANITFTFTARLLTKIEVDFQRPPSFQAAVADYERQFGTPIEKTLKSQIEVSRVRWQNNAEKGRLLIELTETQGMMHAVFERR
jgi:hypothetical protein